MSSLNTLRVSGSLLHVTLTVRFTEAKNSRCYCHKKEKQSSKQCIYETNVAQSKADKCLSSVSHCSPLNCCFKVSFVA